MKKKKLVKKKLEFHRSFQVEKGIYRGSDFGHCMKAIALEKILKKFKKKDIIKETCKLIENFDKNSGNMRGFGDSIEIETNLWVLDKTLDDFEKIMGKKIE